MAVLHSLLSFLPFFVARAASSLSTRLSLWAGVDKASVFCTSATVLGLVSGGWIGRLLDGRLATGSVTEDMVGLVVKAAEEADESALCASAAGMAFLNAS